MAGTPQHPIWSVERQDWLELGDFVAGDHLSTEDGPAKIIGGRALTTGESVYNIEVFGDHIYQVGDRGVLVHNSCKTRANHVYKIFSRKHGVIKYGVGSNLTMSGKSVRAQSQLSKLRKKYGDVEAKIVRKNITRAKAHSVEQGFVNQIKQVFKTTSVIRRTVEC